MKKRFICLLLTLCLFAALLPTAVFADSATDAKFDFFLPGQDKLLKPADVTTTDGFADDMLDDVPALTINAGDEPQYYATKQNDPNFPNNYYLTPGTSEDWNVKFEYPADGIPTVTLKDAKIVNRFGLWFGGVNIPMTSDIQIILEGENHIEYVTPNEDAVFPAHGLFNINTTGTVTITGDGKLTFTSDSHSYNTGVIMGRGDIILDHVDIFMSLPETKGKSNGIHTTGGDVIIKGGNWTVDSYDNPDTLHADGQTNGFRNNQEAIHSAVFVQKRADGTGGNFIVEDGANVLIMVSPYVNEKNNGVVMYTEGTFTIKDSTVEIGLIGKVPAGIYLFKEKPTFEYQDDTYYIIATNAKYPDYSITGKFLTPALERVVDWFNYKKINQLTYFKITPGGDGGPTCEMPETAPTTAAPTTAPTTATKPTTATTVSTNPATAPTTSADNTIGETKPDNHIWLYVLLGAVILVGVGVLVLVLVKKNAAAEDAEEDDEGEEDDEEDATEDAE